MTKIVIAGNWKMNKNLKEAEEFIDILKKENLDKIENEVQIYAPSVFLERLIEKTKNTKIVVGSQNVHEEENGAYTGEISCDMLKSIGVKNTLIGHSERRQYYNETNEIVNKKVLLALKNNLNIVLCVGETIDERNEKITNDILEKQINLALKNVEDSEMKNIIIAYEPVWAIGTGKTATADDANAACKYIRGVVENLFSVEIANDLVIQYGGSVKPDNISEILSKSDINGALVGGASLDIESYIKLIK